jgi:hypothetical protein
MHGRAARRLPTRPRPSVRCRDAADRDLSAVRHAEHLIICVAALRRQNLDTARQSRF